MAVYPTAGLLAASQALASVYASLAHDEALDVPLYAVADFVQMIGFQQVWDFEREYADLPAADSAQSLDNVQVHLLTERQ